jgi:capsular polysaccharide biosynthesis protein
MEDYSFTEQIQLFKNAKFIIGPTGAAWTNIIFCPSTVKCLCWMPEEINDFSAFSNLAEYSNVDLQYITFKTGIHQNNLHSANYTIDINLINEWLFRIHS